MHAEIRQKVNQYKKLWEKIEFFSYQMEMEGRKYHHALFLRWGKPSGILIIAQDGQIISNHQAKSIVAPMNYYNNIAKGAAKDLVREKSRDIAPMKDLQQWLQDHPVLFSGPMAEDYRNVQAMLKTIIEGQEELDWIFEELKEIDIEARERRGYITMQDVEKFLSLNEKYQSTLYRQGRVQQDNRASIRHLAQFVKERSNSSSGSKRAIDVLTSFLSSSVTRTLDQSLETFEQGLDGKRIRFDSGEAGIRQMLELYREKSRRETENNLFALLRNPQIEKG